VHVSQLLCVDRDPECMFYSGAEYTMNAYRSVPALPSQLSVIFSVFIPVNKSDHRLKLSFTASYGVS